MGRPTSDPAVVWGKERGLTKRLEIEPIYWLECGFTGKYATRKIHAKLHAATEWRINCEQSLFKSKIGEGRTQTRNRRVDQTRELKL